METGAINELSKEAIYVLISIASPVLSVALVIGLLISLLQTLTQIQENTLTFVPKIIGVLITLVLSMEYMLSKLKIFVDHITQYIIQ